MSGKNLTRESFFTDGTWVCPAGVTKVRVLSFVQLGQQIGGPHTPNFTGYVYAWGQNNFGQLGDNTIVAKSSPVLIVGPGSGWLQISAYSNNALGITNLGDAYGWGLNSKGTCGDGTVTSQSVPTLVVGGSKWRVVSASAHCAGIDTSGNAYGWGDNVNGSLGDGTVTSRSSPVLVLESKTWYKIVAGNGPTLAIDTSRAMYAWGLNTNGQLGDGTVVPKSSPVLVLGSKTWAHVAGATANGYGIDTLGNAYGWGLNSDGEIGDGTVVAKSSPILVLGGLKFKKISASSSSDVMALTIDGKAYGWGKNDSGQLGLGDTIPRSSPVLVVGGLTFSDVGFLQSPGPTGGTCYGMTTKGDLYAWGLNVNGELGDGTVVAKSSPVLVLGGIFWRAIQMSQVNESIIDTIPGTSYSIILSTDKTAKFGAIPLYSYGFGAMPVEVTLEYEA